MSIFSQAFLEAEALFDETFGEDYRIFPQTLGADVNKRPGPDATRIAANFAAIPSDVHARAGSENGPSQFDTGRPGHASARLQLSIFEGSLPYRPRKNDLIRPIIVDPVDPTLFAVLDDVFIVTEVRSEGGGRLSIDLNSRPSPGSFAQ